MSQMKLKAAKEDGQKLVQRFKTQLKAKTVIKSEDTRLIQGKQGERVTRAGHKHHKCFSFPKGKQKSIARREVR